MQVEDSVSARVLGLVLNSFSVSEHMLYVGSLRDNMQSAVKHVKFSMRR